MDTLPERECPHGADAAGPSHPPGREAEEGRDHDVSWGDWLEASLRTRAWGTNLEDRAAIGEMPDCDLLRACRAQGAVAEESADDVSQWHWETRFTGPDDPGREAWERRSTRAVERLESIRAEVAKRGLGPPAPPAEAARSMPEEGFEDFFKGPGPID